MRDRGTNSWACRKTGKPEGLCHQIVTFLPPESHLALSMLKRNSRPMTGPSYRFSPSDIVLFFIPGSVSCRPFFIAACPRSPPCASPPRAHFLGVSTLSDTSVAMPWNGRLAGCCTQTWRALPRCGYPYVLFILCARNDDCANDVCADTPAGYDLFVCVAL